MDGMDKVRIDKWLWAVRIFKSRTLAADACKGGRVKVGGESVKASYMLQPGETVTVSKGSEKKVLKASLLIEKRVGAPMAETCYEDLSPPPENSGKEPSVFAGYPVLERKKGSGRPTKRERRKLDDYFGDG